MNSQELTGQRHSTRLYHEGSDHHLADTARSRKGTGPGSSALRTHDASFDVELARGEGVCTRSGRTRTDYQNWRTEMGGNQKPSNMENAANSSSANASKKPSPTYRTVLARRGLLVRDTLGSGSYSKVKLALFMKPAVENSESFAQHDFPDQVAVKIIDRRIAPSDFQEKFLPRELEIWPSISHPNIVKMLHYFTENHRVYMILEYVECGDALRFVQNSGAVSELTGKMWVSQVADAVQYLHDREIAHRDLKLENMLIDQLNTIKICDFGFVKECARNDLSRTFCGSKSYAAPEILKGEPYPPKKADIWAIGVVLFILVTGRMPFDETKGNSSLLDEHRRLDLQWPRGRRSLSAQCKALSTFCLTFQWSKRPTISQVLNHIWFKGYQPSTAK